MSTKRKKVLSEEQRRKISDKLIGRVRSEKSLNKQRASMLAVWDKKRAEGYTGHSEETKQKMKDSWTPERRAAFSERLKSAWADKKELEELRKIVEDLSRR